jgi:hypothetical protein
VSYRRKLHIDHQRVLGGDHLGFPVLVWLGDPLLRSRAEGGHVAHQGGEDIHFTAAGGDRLPHQLVHYHPEKGELKAWVRIPRLAGGADTELYLCYGGAGAPPSGEVWDEGYLLVWEGGADEVPGSGALELGEELTVQTWVHSEVSRPELIQPLVSKWALPSAFGAFAAYEAGNTDGLESIGYYGAIFDGRYVYFSPQRHYQDYTTVHAVVLRYDTHRDFRDPGSYAAYDAGASGGLNTKGYYGGAFDGRYVYFIPRHDGAVFHTRVLRYDTHMDFKRSESWDAYDADLAHSHHGAIFDGRYLYLVPGYAGDVFKEDTLSGTLVRYDTRGGFKDPGSWRSFDASRIAGLQAVGFDGGAFDGRYLYFVPLSKGVVLRYDTRGDLADPQSWRAFDARRVQMEGCIGAVFDGRYVYFVPYGNSQVVRCDTEAEFSAEGSWESYEAGLTSGLETGGFAGGFFDGRYVYFEPFKKKAKSGKGYDFHTYFLRYDIRGGFGDPLSWDACDASATDGLKTIGYQGGAFDGRYFYFAPLINLNDGNKRFFGTLLRYDTVGAQGTFSLRYGDYGHNGSLGAALPGPSFIVNTTGGPLSAAGHRPLLPGWHQVVGVYDGRAIKLFADGALVGERTGSGRLQANEVAVTLGALRNGATRFAGTIASARVSRVARSDDWIKTEYQNLINPSQFVRAGSEEALG